MTAAQIAGQVGLTKQQCAALLTELAENGVARCTSDGTIYSKRMVDDECARQTRAEIGRANGVKGAEFGKLGAEHGKKGGRPKGNNPPQQPGEKPPQNPRSSSSSSSSSSEEKKDSPIGLSKETEIVTNGHDLLGDAPKRATKRCPLDFSVSAILRAEISMDCPGIDIAFETKAFRDHEFKTAHSDWPAAWRNWMRESFKRLPPSAKPTPYLGKTL